MSVNYFENGIGQIASNKEIDVLITIHFVFLYGFICVFGIMANVANMIVFYRQGLNTTTNISFFAMAVSDLCSLLFQLIFSMYFKPVCREMCMYIAYKDVQYLTGGIPHQVFARITCLITVYVTAERYLCVVFPLHIKQMITRERTAMSMVLIYSIMLLCAAPLYVVNRPGWKFYLDVNISLLCIIPLPGHEFINAIEYFMHAIGGLLAFLAVVVLTLLLMMTVKRKSSWRNTVNVKDRSSSLSTKDRKAVTTVVLVAIVLIICYSPATFLSLIMAFQPEFSMSGKYHRLYHIVWSFALLFEVINSSVNIFLYINTNSNFRREFILLFCDCMKGKRNKFERYITYH